MKERDKAILIPTVATFLILAGLVGLVFFFYLFYKAELRDAIYTSVLSETKNALKEKVSSYISMVNREMRLGIIEAKNQVKEEVENAWTIANTIYSYCHFKKCSQYATKALIKRVLRNYRFWNGGGYIFIDSVKGSVILNPAFPKLEGKSMWNWKDAKGKLVHREFERVALYSPTGGGFVSYYWFIPGSKKVDEKISFVKLFEPYNWIIGSGVYFYQVRKRVEGHVREVGKAFNAFIIDLNSKDKGRYWSLIKGVKKSDLENGVFVQSNDGFFYFKYYPEFNWVLGAFITNNELAKSVYYLKEQFITKANKVITLTSILILLIVLVSSGALLKSNFEMEKIISELRKRKRELLKMTRRLKLLAYKDDITRLPNRRKLFEDLAKLGLSRNIHFALINIRNFRDINELFGFEDGNKILRDFGKNLKSEAKKSCKECVVYRIRGDKFGLLACDYSEARFIELVRKVISSLERHEFEVNGIKFKLDVVSGISKNPDNLIIEAEIAEEEAKKRNLTVYVFDRELQKTYKELEKNLKVANYIKQAIEERKVIPFFQPIVRLDNLEVFEYEALMRIESPEEILHPGQFLAVAKKIGAYGRLSKELLERAFEACSEERVRISVNLSTEDLSSKKMIDWIVSALNRYDVARLVCFEIVETEAFSDLKVLEDFFFKVKELGSHLAIDDFGSGYSNYEYLATVKPDFVKIDGSLISKIITSQEVEKLVKHLVVFCKDLEIKTIAEFVSSKELYEKVRELGIDYGQGFYFGKPSPEIKNQSDT
ncbi:EAL domain-containing protein [Thermovibrio sp.]